MTQLKILKIILCVILLFVYINSVSALGFGPVQIYKVYDAGKTEELRFKIFNDERRNIHVQVLVRGELSKYITIETTDLYLSKTQNNVDLILTLDHPMEESKLHQGVNYAEVLVSEIPNSDQNPGTVIAKLVQISTIQLQVPYKEKYAEAKLEIIPNINSALFNIYVYNYGLDTINVNSDINIYNIYNNQSLFIKNKKTKTFEIKSMSEKEISENILLNSGVYLAKADIIYDGKIINLEKNFMVGQDKIVISNITVSEFTPGEIAPIKIALNNPWLKPYNDVYVKIEFMNNNNINNRNKNSTNIINNGDKININNINNINNYIIDSITTESFDIVHDKEVTAFWDTKNIELGSYQARAYVYYDNKVTTKDFVINVGQPENYLNDQTINQIIENGDDQSKDKTKIPAWSWLVIIIVIIAIIIGIFAFFIINWQLLPKQRRKRPKK